MDKNIPFLSPIIFRNRRMQQMKWDNVYQIIVLRTFIDFSLMLILTKDIAFNLKVAFLIFQEKIIYAWNRHLVTFISLLFSKSIDSTVLTAYPYNARYAANNQ